MGFYLREMSHAPNTYLYIHTYEVYLGHTRLYCSSSVQPQRSRGASHTAEGLNSDDSGSVRSEWPSGVVRILLGDAIVALSSLTASQGLGFGKSRTYFGLLEVIFFTRGCQMVWAGPGK